MYYEKMCLERERLEQKLADVQEKMNDFPDGKLVCAKSGDYVKWYQSDGHNCRYLPKKERELAEQLAMKRYLIEKRKDLLVEIRAVEAYLRHGQKDALHAEMLLAPESPYRELLHDYFRPNSEELAEWMEADYERNMIYPEHCIHKTSMGILVRSKSEALIATFLHTNKIPFHYEEKLKLGENAFYPDFTIRHPKDGRLFFWEHFGMMDNPNYVRHTFAKLEQYSKYDIVPSVNLLTTYETKEHPLDMQMVENLVGFYFL